VPGKKTVLVADDERAIRNLVTVTLQNRGFSVETAEDGEEAVDKAKLLSPALIVLDVMMPKMDGWEVRRRLREDPNTSHVPIVILSAVGEFEAQLAGMQSEADDYMTKPFVPSELGDMVEAMLDPARRERLAQAHKSKQAKLKTIVDIMHRSRDE
jgi:DNA-binding response OmpR family regulator